MRVLITGAAGFIGAHAAARLHAEGCEVVGVDNLNAYYEPALKRARLAWLGERMRFVEADFAEPESFGAMMARERPEVVLHLGAQAGVRYSLEAPFAYAHSNLTGHLSVLEACRRAEGLTRLVYASSSSVYGADSQAPFSEDARADRPVSLYAATKRADELLSAAYGDLYGFEQIGLRFFTVYGPFGRPDMAYWSFTADLFAGRPIRVFNAGRMRRDFTYVDDVIEGVVAVCLREPVESPTSANRIYNIGAHRPTPLMDFIAELERATGRKGVLQMEPMQAGDVPETYADVSRIARDYGWSARTPLSEGLDRFVRWWRDYHRL